MQLRRELSVYAIAVFSMFLGAAAAKAVPLTYDITGVVAIVDDTTDLFGGAYSVGQPFTATATYDTAIPDTDASGSTGFYGADPAAGLLDMTMSLGALDISTDPASSWGSVLVLDQSNDLLRMVLNDPIVSSPLRVLSVELLLNATGSAVFPDDSLPTDLNVDDFDITHSFSFVAGPINRLAFIFGDIQSIELRTIPEPSTGLLIAAGLLVAVRRSRA